jgi:hypothetical protein
MRQGELTIETPANWTRRQIALAILLLVVFIATAAVVPVLISPSSGQAADPAPQASPQVVAAGVTAGPTPSPSPTPTPSTSGTPTPTPKPKPKQTVSPFLVRPAVKPLPVGHPPNKVYREFMSVCSPTRLSSRSPLAGLVAPGQTAQYQFAGSLSSKVAAPGQVPTSGTSCVAAGDRSTYWAPVLRQGSTVLRPEAFEIYYKAGVEDYTTVQPFPAGLRMVVGGPTAAASTPDQYKVSWSCSNYGSTALPKAGTCQPGDRLVLQMRAPSCWDGQHLDVAGHRNHLAWPVANRCPGGHPIPVPELLMWVGYPLNVAADVKSDAGAGDDFSYGFVAGWQKSALTKMIKDCIHGGQQCDDTGKPR